MKTKFIPAKIYTIERRETDIIFQQYEYIVREHKGFVFHILDDTTGSFVQLGLYMPFKLWTVVDMETGLKICTSHYRSDSKQDCVDWFMVRYKDRYIDYINQDKELRTRQKEIFEYEKSKLICRQFEQAHSLM